MILYEDIFDAVDVWDDSDTVYSAIKMNVTNTASAAGSRLLDFQINGADFCSLSKESNLVFSGSTAIGTGNYLILGGNDTNPADTGALSLSENIGAFRGDMRLFWSPSDSWAGGYAFCLENDGLQKSDGSNTMGLSGFNPVGFRIYNATDATDYSRLEFGWNGNDMVIATQAIGTGVQGNLSFSSANQATYDAAPLNTTIRDILISFGLMAPM